MPLLEGQVQMRGLMLGCGTSFRVVGFNPWSRESRVDVQPRAWAHGSLGSVEWIDAMVVPVRVHVQAGTVAAWLPLQQQLDAAWTAQGDDQIGFDEMRFTLGGREYLMFGHPRSIEIHAERVMKGRGLITLAFAAYDPLIYSGIEHTLGPVLLPVQAGGLLIPLLVPLHVGGTLAGGTVVLVNEGTKTTGLLLRIDGPVTEPSVTLQRSDGIVQTIRWHGFILPAGRFLLVDTKARTAFIDGFESSSQHPGHVDWPLLPPGTSTLRFGAADFDAGTLTVTWRDAW